MIFCVNSHKEQKFIIKKGEFRLHRRKKAYEIKYGHHRTLDQTV